MTYAIIYFKTDGLAYPHLTIDNSLMLFDSYEKADKECLKLEKELKLKGTDRHLVRIIPLEIVKNPKNL